MELVVDQPFNLAATLECGQGHRWRRKCKALNSSTGTAWYENIVGKDLIYIRQTNDPNESDMNTLEFSSPWPDIVSEAFLHWHFRLSDDIYEAYAKLWGTDIYMRNLVRNYWGLRVMRADPWECLVFFVLSGNKRIETTKGQMEKMASTFRGLRCWDRKTRHPFPTSKQIDEYSTKPQCLTDAVGSKHDQYIYDAACEVSQDRLNLERLRKRASYEESRAELMRNPGIGPKVSDCIALFNLGKLEAFPIDTRIFNSLNRGYSNVVLPQVNRKSLYNEKSRRDLPGNEYRQLLNWAQGRFGSYAGYASQFLFYDDLCTPKARGARIASGH